MKDSSFFRIVKCNQTPNIWSELGTYDGLSSAELDLDQFLSEDGEAQYKIQRCSVETIYSLNCEEEELNE